MSTSCRRFSTRCSFRFLAIYRQLPARAGRDGGAIGRRIEAMSGTIGFVGAAHGRARWARKHRSANRGAYDLATDPGEQANVISNAPPAGNASWRASGGIRRDATRGAAIEDPEVARRLQSLGYVSGSAPRKARYAEDDDPKRLADLDRALHEAVGLDEAGNVREAWRLPADPRPASRHDGGLAAPRARLLAHG
jgi:hypothetical protein